LGRIFVIGDVHGCIEELQALVKELSPKDGDRFAFLGDLVDKGPDSLAVLRYVVKLLSDYPKSTCIAGNHEEKAWRLAMKAKEGRVVLDSGVTLIDAEKEQVWDRLEPWAKQASDENWAFIKSMPLLHRIPEYKVLLVHGGLFPKFFKDYPEGIGEIPTDWHKGGGKKMDRARRFLRIRTVDPEGEMIKLGEEKEDSTQWADVYDGREGFVYYGHEPFHAGPYYSTHATGLDTGCVFGGDLTAAILEGEMSPKYAKIVPIKAKATYCAKREE
jgi:hypothetical protein